MTKVKSEDKRYEDEVLASFESSEWQSVPGLKEEIAQYASAASATLTKDKRINITRSTARSKKVHVG